MDNEKFSWSILDNEEYIQYVIDDERETKEWNKNQTKSYYMNRHGSITSPNYPLNYPEESNFRYTIISLKAANVVLVFDDVNVEASISVPKLPPCSYDAVNVEAKNCATVSYVDLKL